MNNEPVAWAYEAINVDGKPYLSDVALKPLFGLVARYGYKEIPLYTHPAKTLTDEEINIVAILQDAEIVPVGHEIWKTSEEFNKYKKIVLATAKALRKAQEK